MQKTCGKSINVYELTPKGKGCYPNNYNIINSAYVQCIAYVIVNKDVILSQNDTIVTKENIELALKNVAKICAKKGDMLHLEKCSHSYNNLEKYLKFMIESLYLQEKTIPAN
jgi:hypothetical protein